MNNEGSDLWDPILNANPSPSSRPLRNRILELPNDLGIVEMKITNQEKNITTLVSNDSQYFVTRHSCPECTCILFTCSCPNFQMGITHRGGNPFVKGCKHIEFVRKEVKLKESKD